MTPGDKWFVEITIIIVIFCISYVLMNKSITMQFCSVIFVDCCKIAQRSVPENYSKA